MGRRRVAWLRVIEQLVLDKIAWRKIRSLPGSSEYVPEAVNRLMSARTEEEAEEAYWQLDNRVVVQGQLFEAAKWIVAPLMISLPRLISPCVRIRVVNLLVEISLSQPDVSEEKSGNAALASDCLQELRRGLWILYSLLDDASPSVRVGVLDLLDNVELDRDRLVAIAREIAVNERVSVVRERASEILQ